MKYKINSNNKIIVFSNGKFYQEEITEILLIKLWLIKLYGNKRS